MLKSLSVNASRHKLFGLDVLATYGDAFISKKMIFTDEGICRFTDEDLSTVLCNVML